jgi:hypothetical protein
LVVENVTLTTNLEKTLDGKGDYGRPERWSRRWQTETATKEGEDEKRT